MYWNSILVGNTDKRLKAGVVVLTVLMSWSIGLIQMYSMDFTVWVNVNYDKILINNSGIQFKPELTRSLGHWYYYL